MSRYLTNEDEGVTRRIDQCGQCFHLKGSGIEGFQCGRSVIYACTGISRLNPPPAWCPLPTVSPADVARVQERERCLKVIREVGGASTYRVVDAIITAIEGGVA